MFPFLLSVVMTAGAFDQSYQDYLFNYNQYRQNHTAYLVAQQAYLNYRTLTAKNEAQNKTLMMLKSGEETLITYLIALKNKIIEGEGLPNQEKEGYLSQLENEIIWYKNHQERLPSAGTLEDLGDSAQELRQHYRHTEVLIYQTLLLSLSGKENFWRNRVIDQIVAARSELISIRQKGGKQITLAERWLLEAENRVTRSQEKQQKANEKLVEITQSSNRNEVYNQSQFALIESHQYLKEATSYLKELIREIKTADR